MKTITLGTTGITSPQNAFGALPVQRVDTDTAVKLLRKAYEGGMTYFDTARAYSDSEYKLGKPTGHYGYSGYCSYPEYKFDMDEVRNYCINPDDIPAPEPKKKEKEHER